MRGLAMLCMRDWRLDRWRWLWARSCGVEVLRLRSEAEDRATYLKRPDLGRKLDDASRGLVAGKKQSEERVLALVIADGLSALAVERHAPALLKELLPRLGDWTAGADLHC